MMLTEFWWRCGVMVSRKEWNFGGQTSINARASINNRPN